MLTCAKPQVFPEPVALAEMANALAELTGVDSVVAASLISISSNFSPVRLSAPKLRYCPICFQADNPYERALWAFAAVTSCPVCRVRLVEPVCRAPMDERLKPSHVVLKSGVCNRCGSIGLKCGRPLIQPATEEEHWGACQVFELVAFVTGGGKIEQAKLREGIAACVERVGGQRKLSSLCNFPREVVFKARKKMGGPGLVALKTVLSIAAVCKVTLLSLVMGDLRNDEDAPHIEASRASPGDRKDVRLPEAIRVIEHGLKILPTTSLSGNDFAELLGMSPSYFAASFPECWSAIVQKRREHVLQRVAADRVALKNSIRRKAVELIQEGERVTGYLLKCHFGGDTSYSELRILIKEVLEEDGIRSNVR